MKNDPTIKDVYDQLSLVIQFGATKEDLGLLRAELKTEIADVKTELRAEIAQVKTELRVEIAELRTELKTEIIEAVVEAKEELKDKISSVYSAAISHADIKSLQVAAVSSRKMADHQRRDKSFKQKLLAVIKNNSLATDKEQQMLAAQI